MYIQKGSVKISVLSRTGREAVVAMLSPGDFFGEGALTLSIISSTPAESDWRGRYCCWPGTAIREDLTAEMVGTTRSRVNTSLLSVVLHD